MAALTESLRDLSEALEDRRAPRPMTLPEGGGLAGIADEVRAARQLAEALTCTWCGTHFHHPDPPGPCRPLSGHGRPDVTSEGGPASKWVEDHLPEEFMADHLASPQLDRRNRVAGQLLRRVNPLARRLITAGLPTGAPNVLLTMRGRRSGKLRSIPVGMLELAGRWYVQASYGETGWVANLRADGEATVIHPDGRRVPVHAVELSPEEGGAVLLGALQRFRRSRLLRALVGPSFRPPVGVLLTLRIRVDETIEEYTAEARRHPLFELRPAGH